MSVKWNLLVAIAMWHVTGSLAVTTSVIPPIRSNGDEVALIFVPATGIEGEAYAKTAMAIQTASPIRLWVALTGNYTLQIPNSLELPVAITDAISALQKAGMNGDNYVGVAHSSGGSLLASYAKSSALDAVVLMGSYLSRDTSLSEYTLPVLTLSGELDGLARITRIALEYQQLQNDVHKSPLAIFRTPVINIQGVNHAQFASGPMPSIVRKYDLQPEVTENEAHGKIGGHVSNFLTVTFHLPASAVQTAQVSISAAFNESASVFQPLLKVKGVDVKGSVSPWCVMAQLAIAGNLQNRTKVLNKLLTNPEFIQSKPEISQSEGEVIVETTAVLSPPLSSGDFSSTAESPGEIDLKLKSYDAIKEALNVTSSSNTNVSCKALNQMAVNIALSISRPEAKARYFTKGRPIILLDDIVYGTGIEWVTASLSMTENTTGLHVRSAALSVPMQSPIYPGNFYCKALSPYRAMEWIHVDSLRLFTSDSDSP